MPKLLTRQTRKTFMKTQRNLLKLLTMKFLIFLESVKVRRIKFHNCENNLPHKNNPLNILILKSELHSNCFCICFYGFKMSTFLTCIFLLHFQFFTKRMRFNSYDHLNSLFGTKSTTT